MPSIIFVVLILFLSKQLSCFPVEAICSFCREKKVKASALNSSIAWVCTEPSKQGLIWHQELPRECHNAGPKCFLGLVAFPEAS